MVAVSDFRYRKIKNVTQIVGCIVLIFSAVIGGINPLNFAFGIFVALVFIVFYKLRLMAAGDVKFIFLVGIFFGYSLDFLIVLLIANFFSMLHVFLFALRRKIKSINLFLYINFFEGNSIYFWARIPYAGYVAISAIAWMLYMPKP